MIIIIDLDLQQAVSGFGSKQPAPPIQVKSQDTPTLAIYFTKGSVNYDLGASPGLRFGIFVTGNPNPLVAYNAFTKTLDAQSRVTYVGYPNFNTTAMAAAIGSQPQLSCIGEIRYQTSFGTIARTADIDFTIVRPLLSETVMDTLIAAFVTPAVNANVTARINSTSWLSVGLNISIGAGAGAYQVVSITNLTDFVAKNLGAAGNAGSGTTIPIGTSVGIAPVNVLAAYPDPSIIEVTTHKDSLNGYAGLDGAGLLKGTEMPVDTKTIVVSGGKLASAAILTTTAANFTTPVATNTVNVTLASTSGLVAGQYVRIPIAGYYIVTTITDLTHAVLTNSGDPVNASGGVVITSGAVLLPAQAAAGGGGGSGIPGQNAYTQTTASFTVPAVNAPVTVTVGNTAWMGGSGYLVFLSGAGYYSVSSITDAANVVLTNIGSAGNAPSGSTVPSGVTVAPAGPTGAAGIPGPGLAAYDVLASPFTMPAAAANVTIAIGSTAWLATGQVIYIASAGYFQVAAISSATQASVKNLNYPGNASSGGTIASGSDVSPGGLIGPAGAGGAGLNAFTSLSANYTQPAVNATVAIVVGTTAWMALGQVIYIAGGGYYSVTTISDLTHVTVTNLGYAGNAAPAATVTSGLTVAVTPGGLAGQAGRDAFTTTSASFTMPTSGATVTVSVGAAAWMAQGQILFIPTAGYFSVSVITDAIHVVLTNLGYTGNAGSGTVIGSGSSVVAAGVQGAAGSGGGGGGGTLSDATTATGYSIISNPVGVLKRVAAGSSAITIADSGSVLTVDAPGAGGGGGLVARTTGVELFDDFTGAVNAPTTTAQGALGWMLGNFGGSTGSLAANSTLTGPEIGTWQFSAPPSGTGVSQLMVGSIAAGFGIAAAGQGTLIAEWRVKISGALETISNYADHRFGINGSNPTATNWAAAYFQYNVSIGPNWQCVSYNGTTAISADSGVAVNATSYVKLTITMNAAWTTATFAINGTTVATLTGVSFGAGVGWTPAATGKWGAGSPSIAFLDWFYAKYTVSR